MCDAYVTTVQLLISDNFYSIRPISKFQKVSDILLLLLTQQ